MLRFSFCGVATLLLLPSCVTPEEALRNADESAYSLLEENAEAVFGETSDFTIEAPVDSLRQRILLGELSGPIELSLLDCLKIFSEDSPQYQRKKEELYLSALDLRLEQWQFESQFFFSGSASAPSDEAAVSAGLQKALGTGANILADIGSNMFAVVSSDQPFQALGAATFSITQPLLGGASADVIREPLTQAERNLVYATRSFERYRRSFAIDLAFQYFQLIESIRNFQIETKNFEGLLLLAERNEALSEAGQLNDIEADQARQDTLESSNRLLELDARVNKQLDDFKLLLGLPVGVEITLPESDFDVFSQFETYLLDLDESIAVQTSLSSRLDYLNQADAVLDSERRVVVAEEALKAGLGINANTSYQGDGALEWSAGLSLDLPIDQIPQQNAYRSSLIAREKSSRDEQLLKDTIVASLRENMRNLHNSIEGVAIQQSAIELAEKRVESTDMNLAAGRSDTRSVLEARRALVSAQNSLAAAERERLTARLSLSFDLGVLRVGAAGFEFSLADSL
ncbi:MAG: TolC family protein [Planctomycetes bacterium]|nr:TolC family protein [Planctomycetota bacterium]